MPLVYAPYFPVLEQYPSTAHLAACMAHTAAGDGDIEGHSLFSPPHHVSSSYLSTHTLILTVLQMLGMAVADLGCGTCMLAISAAIMGARCLPFVLTSTLATEQP